MTTSIDIEKLRFAQKQRLTYLESVAYWEGAIDRPRISSVFDVSENHVTKDFRLYKESFPGNIRYDEISRVYRPTKRFKPRIGTGTAEEYLSILRTYAERENSTTIPDQNPTIPVYALSRPQGTVDKEILNAITRSISSRRALEINYQSMTRASANTKIVWPHALLFSGTRWHARAYDEDRAQYIDLVLQRVLTAKSADNKKLPFEAHDDQWEHFVDVDVIPKPTLTANQAAVVAREFGMVKEGNKWIWRASMRECMVGYFIVHHRLDVENDERRLIALRDHSLIAKHLPPSDFALNRGG
ncbi:MAG: WYL domain-containing protein [Burkholderiales bacterium]|nr:WYL domain-containing protein [Burkholderiales bacterium]